MQIAQKSKSSFAVALYLAAGWLIGTFALRAGLVFSVALFTVFSFAVLIYFYPIIGILLIVGGTSFIPYDSELPLAKVGSIHIPDLVLYLLFFVVILRAILLRKSRLVRTPMDVPLIIFVVVGIISLVVGGLLQAYPFFEGFREFKIMLYYLLPLVLTNLIQDKRELKLLIYGCLWLGIMAALGVILKAWISPPKPADDAMEVFYRYQGESSAWVLLLWTFATFFCFLIVRKMRLSYLLGAIIALFALIVSFSRHLWIGVACGVLLGLAINFRPNKGRILKVLSFVIFVFLILLGASALRIEPVRTYLNLITTRAETLISPGKVDNWNIRLVENEYAKEKIASNPIWGIGFARPYRPEIYGLDDVIEWFIHNGYLWILLKLGIAGFIPFLWFSYIFVRRGVRYWNRVEDNFLKAIVLGSVCFYLGLAIANVAAPHFMQNWEVATIGLSFGINEVIYRIEGIG
jgi:O-antigen ligase